MLKFSYIFCKISKIKELSRLKQKFK